MAISMIKNHEEKCSKFPRCIDIKPVAVKQIKGIAVAVLTPTTMENVSYWVSISAERIFRETSQAVTGNETTNHKIKWVALNGS